MKISAAGRPSRADGSAMAGLSSSTNLNASRSKLHQPRTDLSEELYWHFSEERNGCDDEAMVGDGCWVNAEIGQGTFTMHENDIQPAGFAQLSAGSPPNQPLSF